MVMVTKSGHNGENKPAKIVQESVRVKALERPRERESDLSLEVQVRIEWLSETSAY